MFSRRRQLPRSSTFRARSTQWRPATATTVRRSGRWRRRRRSVLPRSDGDRPPIQSPLLLRLRSSFHDPVAINDAAAATHRLQTVPEFLGDRAGVDTVPNELCLDEDDDLGPRLGVGGVSKHVTEKLDFTKSRDARFRLLTALADKAGKQHGLTAGHRDGGVD